MREIERRKLNVMESLIVASLIGLGALIFSMREAVIQMQAAVAYQADELKSLRTQLADVPQLSRQVAELKVRVDRHDEDLKELRSVRGLK